jgi:cytochrome c biogenesis protein ResB
MDIKISIKKDNNQQEYSFTVNTPFQLQTALVYVNEQAKKFLAGKEVK